MRQECVSPTRQLGVYAYRGHTVLEFRGEIDLVAAEEIGPVLDRITAGTGVRAVIDLRQVEFFDCSGLRLLYRAHARVRERGGRLHLVCTRPLTLRVFRVTGLARLLPPQPDLDTALDRAAAVAPDGAPA
ncbi:anti-sigma factor antagonist [Streptomyces sp. NPDC017248]|uniref:anti-sigma factor antagonist n=1 Tax=unclassified Streptomyces TaxID=2593676 RepID=UPI003418C44C